MNGWMVHQVNGEYLYDFMHQCSYHYDDKHIFTTDQIILPWDYSLSFVCRRWFCEVKKVCDMLSTIAK